MTYVAGLDPSLTSAGLAALRPGEAPRLGTVGAPGLRTDTYEDRRDRIELQAFSIGKRIGNPDLIVIEGPYYHGKLMPSYFDRAGLFWGLMSSLSRRAPIAVVSPTTRAKYATGSGNAKKDEVLAAVRTMWPGVAIRNHDEADALILASIGNQKLGLALPFPIRPRHTLALDAVAWPADLPISQEVSA